MPRANRYTVPGHIWHLTHRCHEKQFLLRFARDRRRWLHWLFEAKKRFGLCVLNYVVTSNHIHLLVQDGGRGEIARSMQLVAGRTAQEYNLRKARRGAFWEDRYHATAVDTQGYLARCLTYIDLNMVRAGVVAHPGLWSHGGYHEAMTARQRYAIVSRPALLELLGLPDWSQLRRARQGWIENSLRIDGRVRQAHWSESVAVGSQAFVEAVKSELGARARHRDVEVDGEDHCLRDAAPSYGTVFEPAIGPARAKTRPDLDIKRS